MEDLGRCYVVYTDTGQNLTQVWMSHHSTILGALVHSCFMVHFEMKCRPCGNVGLGGTGLHLQYSESIVGLEVPGPKLAKRERSDCSRKARQIKLSDHFESSNFVLSSFCGLQVFLSIATNSRWKPGPVDVTHAFAVIECAVKAAAWVEVDACVIVPSPRKVWRTS